MIVWSGPGGGSELAIARLLALLLALFFTSAAFAQTYPAVQPARPALPVGSTPVTASATGTTAATTATLPAATNGQNTYVCGFSILANATAAATGAATMTGVVSGTMTFEQWTAPLASGMGNTSAAFNPCIPSSAANTAIAVVSAAPGSGGNVTVNVWGYYY